MSLSTVSCTVQSYLSSFTSRGMCPNTRKIMSLALTWPSPVKQNLTKMLRKEEKAQPIKEIFGS